MEELKEKVAALRKATNDDARIRILQQINELLLTKYAIKIGDLKVVPLWVEAYYYDKGKFCDCNIHMSDKQKGRPGQLYFHETGYGGLDICLSDESNYYLSILLKATLVCKDGQEEYKTQTQIYDILPVLNVSEKDMENMKDILVPSENGWTKIIHTKRVNLTKPCYQEECLAAVPIDVISRYDMRKFARASLAESAAQYIAEFKKENPFLTKKDYEKECKRVFGWLPDSVGKLLKGLT